MLETHLEQYGYKEDPAYPIRRAAPAELEHDPLESLPSPSDSPTTAAFAVASAIGEPLPAMPSLDIFDSLSFEVGLSAASRALLGIADPAPKEKEKEKKLAHAPLVAQPLSMDDLQAPAFVPAAAVPAALPAVTGAMAPAALPVSFDDVDTILASMPALNPLTMATLGASAASLAVSHSSEPQSAADHMAALSNSLSASLASLPHSHSLSASLAASQSAAMAHPVVAQSDTSAFRRVAPLRSSTISASVSADVTPVVALPAPLMEPSPAPTAAVAAAAVPRAPSPVVVAGPIRTVLEAEYMQLPTFLLHHFQINVRSLVAD